MMKHFYGRQRKCYEQLVGWNFFFFVQKNFFGCENAVTDDVHTHTHARAIDGVFMDRKFHDVHAPHICDDVHAPHIRDDRIKIG